MVLCCSNHGFLSSVIGVSLSWLFIPMCSQHTSLSGSPKFVLRLTVLTIVALHIQDFGQHSISMIFTTLVTSDSGVLYFHTEST